MADILGSVCFLWSDGILHRPAVVVDTILFLPQSMQLMLLLHDIAFHDCVVYLSGLVFCTMGGIQWFDIDIQQHH